MNGCKHTRAAIDAKGQFVVVENATLRCTSCEVLHVVPPSLDTDKGKWDAFLAQFGIALTKYYEGSEYELGPEAKVRTPYCVLLISFDGDGKFECVRTTS